VCEMLLDRMNYPRLRVLFTVLRKIESAVRARNTVRTALVRRQRKTGFQTQVRCISFPSTSTTVEGRSLRARPSNSKSSILLLLFFFSIVVAIVFSVGEFS
jgi:hypothetical protein